MEEESSHLENIGFIGGGNMASAICYGIIDRGVYKPCNIWVSGPHPEKLDHLRKLGVNVTSENAVVVQSCAAIFVCVKPHMLKDALEDCAKASCDRASMTDRLWISILAGTTLFKLEQALTPFRPCRVVRVMPNTPMLLGEGAAVYAPGDAATADDCDLVERILECCCGAHEKVPEGLIDAIGGLSGSGPAFVYLAIEALADGGVKQGVPRPMATRFAAQTVLGAAKMVLDTGRHPGQLKDEVCSAGGSTICGVHALEKGGVRGAYIDAVEAAVKRSIAMGQEN